MRQHIVIITVLVAGLLLQTASAFSAEEPDASDIEAAVAEDIESIIVTGRRPGALRQLMLDYVIEIGDPASRSRGYARWRDSLCAGVYNLPDQRVAQYIADKISRIALEAGLNTGSPGCQPNLEIIFSPDARALATSMVNDSPEMFLPFGNTETTTQGLVALEQFKATDAPVRWWQITMVVDETGQPAIQLPGMDTPFVRSVASRLKSTTSDAIIGSLIIVDASKLKNVKWPQLADYLAMVALAQVDPNALPSGHDSILNLFSAAHPPLGITDMDLTYLRALYEMDTMLLPDAQRGSLTNTMVRMQTRMEEQE